MNSNRNPKSGVRLKFVCSPFDPIKEFMIVFQKKEIDQNKNKTVDIEKNETQKLHQTKNIQLKKNQDGVIQLVLKIETVKKKISKNPKRTSCKNYDCLKNNFGILKNNPFQIACRDKFGVREKSTSCKSLFQSPVQITDSPNRSLTATPFIQKHDYQSFGYRDFVKTAIVKKPFAEPLDQYYFRFHFVKRQPKITQKIIRCNSHTSRAFSPKIPPDISSSAQNSRDCQLYNISKRSTGLSVDRFLPFYSNGLKFSDRNLLSIRELIEIISSAGKT